MLTDFRKVTVQTGRDRKLLSMIDLGKKAMKASYVAEAKLRHRKTSESFRDFGQAIQDFYRRAYPENREYVQESSMKTFIDNCSENEKKTKSRNKDL